MSILLLLVKILVSLAPVLVFLAALIALDSFKLVRLRAVMIAIAVGSVSAMAALLLNGLILEAGSLDGAVLARYVAPVVEEVLKAAYVVLLFKGRRVGFMVDGAIFGFAVGSGFALVENTYYLHIVHDENILLWILRGFGTAVMHGGTTAIFAIVSKGLIDRHGMGNVLLLLPGLLIAMGIHSAFNHVFLPPLLSTVTILVLLPVGFFVAFQQSENATRHWLGVGFDTDRELLEMIVTGTLTETRIGQYLHELADRFSPTVVADMLCLLRLHLELAISAKAVLMMREAGFELPPDPEVKAKFDEMQYLEKSIGATGILALHPFLHTSERSLWQLHMLRTG